MKESMCSRWHLRLIVLLILFFPLTLSAAQGRVTVKGQSITLRQAIKIIESSSNFKFFFNPSDLDALPGKNLDCEGEISDVLKEVFAGSGISYVIMGDDIILKLEKKAASTQQKKVEIVGRCSRCEVRRIGGRSNCTGKRREQRSDYRYGRKVYD